VLVAIRSREPGIGQFDVPGGFCDGAETFETSIARELEEEIGLSPSDYTAPEYLLSGLDRYEYGGEKIDVLSNIYYAKLIGNPTLDPQDDVAEAYFMPIHEVDPDKVYFKGVRDGLLKLREQVE